jgi:hypothetical protein
MAVSPEYQRLAMKGLLVELQGLADERGLVMLTVEQIAERVGIERRAAMKLLKDAETAGMIWRGIGKLTLKASRVTSKDTGVTFKATGVTLNAHGHERVRDHENHENHAPMVLHEKKKEEEEVDRRRRLKFFEENTELKVLWATYRHNPGTNPNRDMDESIELWPKVVDHLGMPAIIEHFEKLDEAAIRCDKSTRFVEQLNRLMSRIVL